LDLNVYCLKALKPRDWKGKFQQGGEQCFSLSALAFSIAPQACAMRSTSTCFAAAALPARLQRVPSVTGSVQPCDIVP
jgi:hypothetical protein